MTEDNATAPSSTVASLPREVMEELAAIGAAIGSNCEPCLTFHYDRARRLGFTNEQLAPVVTMAQRVKNAPAAKILALAASLLDVDIDAITPRSRT